MFVLQSHTNITNGLTAWDWIDYLQQAFTQSCTSCSIMLEAHHAGYGNIAAYSATSPNIAGVQLKVKQAIRKASCFEAQA